MTDTTPRPAPSENHLLINAYTTHPESPAVRHPPHRRQRLQSGGRTPGHGRPRCLGHRPGHRLLGLGGQAGGDADRLEREEGLKLVWYRTAAKQAQSNLLPYIVEVIAADKPGILFQLADFFDRQGITIENLQSTRYRAMQTGAEMFSAQVTIGVPANMHIAALRDDFLEFCDHLNLDAIMDPMKF